MQATVSGTCAWTRCFINNHLYGSETMHFASIESDKNNNNSII